MDVDSVDSLPSSLDLLFDYTSPQLISPSYAPAYGQVTRSGRTSAAASFSTRAPTASSINLIKSLNPKSPHIQFKAGPNILPHLQTRLTTHVNDQPVQQDFLREWMLLTSGSQVASANSVGQSEQARTAGRYAFTCPSVNIFIHNAANFLNGTGPNGSNVAEDLSFKFTGLAPFAGSGTSDLAGFRMESTTIDDDMITCFGDEDKPKLALQRLQAIVSAAGELRRGSIGFSIQYNVDQWIINDDNLHKTEMHVLIQIFDQLYANSVRDIILHGHEGFVAFHLQGPTSVLVSNVFGLARGGFSVAAAMVALLLPPSNAELEELSPHTIPSLLSLQYAPKFIDEPLDNGVTNDAYPRQPNRSASTVESRNSRRVVRTAVVPHLAKAPPSTIALHVLAEFEESRKNNPFAIHLQKSVHGLRGQSIWTLSAGSLRDSTERGASTSQHHHHTPESSHSGSPPNTIPKPDAVQGESCRPATPTSPTWHADVHLKSWLGGDRHSNAFAATMDGLDVVVKVEHFKRKYGQDSENQPRTYREALVYERLHHEGLLGSVAPWFIGLYSVMNANLGAEAYVSIILHAGFGLETQHDSWSCVNSFEALQITNLYNRLHNAGVYHGDVELRHICVDMLGKMKVIDFDRSELDPGQDALASEMADIRRWTGPVF